MALVAGLTVAGCGSTTSPGVAGTTTTSGTPGTRAACPAFGSARPAPGGPAIGPSDLVLLRNVQVQASSCVDEVSYLFWKGTPAWSAGYQDGPLVLDPSGQPAVVPGAAHLVVRLEHSSGVDLSVNPPRRSYDGPTEMSLGSSTDVAGIRRLGDFEGVTTWAVGLPARRPFEVVTRGDQLVLRVAAPAPRSTRCAAPGSRVSITSPFGWYTELSPRWACRYFDPGPFIVYPATDAMGWAVTAQTADASAATLVTRLSSDGSAHVRQARVAGLQATVLDVTAQGQGLYPAGYGFRMYVLPTSPMAFVISSRPSPPGAETDRSRAAADRLAALITIGR